MKRIVLLFLTLVAAPAWALPISSAEIAATPEGGLAQSFAEDLFSRRSTSVYERFAPATRAVVSIEKLEPVYALLPAGTPSKPDFIGWNSRVNRTAAGETSYTDVTMEYAFPDQRWLVFSARMIPTDTGLKVEAFNVTPTTGRQAVLNEFTFSGKGVKHYSFLVLGLVSVGVMLYAFVVCLRTKGLRRKWLWLFVTLIGVTTFSLNWTDGAVHFAPVHLRLFSVGYSRLGLVGPWYLSISLPVGAIYFLARRRCLIANSTKSSAPMETPIESSPGSPTA